MASRPEARPRPRGRRSLSKAPHNKRRAPIGSKVGDTGRFGFVEVKRRRAGQTPPAPVEAPVEKQPEEWEDVPTLSPPSPPPPTQASSRSSLIAWVGFLFVFAALVLMFCGVFLFGGFAYWKWAPDPIEANVVVVEDLPEEIGETDTGEPIEIPAILNWSHPTPVVHDATVPDVGDATVDVPAKGPADVLIRVNDDQILRVDIVCRSVGFRGRGFVTGGQARITNVPPQSCDLYLKGHGAPLAYNGVTGGDQLSCGVKSGSVVCN
jgi:hypothetical protein